MLQCISKCFSVFRFKTKPFYVINHHFFPFFFLVFFFFFAFSCLPYARFLKNFIEIYLIYNVVLVSGVQQNESILHMSILFHIIFLCKLLKNIEQSSLCNIVRPYQMSPKQKQTHGSLRSQPSHPNFVFCWCVHLLLLISHHPCLVRW